MSVYPVINLTSITNAANSIDTFLASLSPTFVNTGNPYFRYSPCLPLPTKRILISSVYSVQLCETENHTVMA